MFSDRIVERPSHYPHIVLEDRRVREQTAAFLVQLVLELADIPVVFIAVVEVQPHRSAEICARAKQCGQVVSNGREWQLPVDQPARLALSDRAAITIEQIGHQDAGTIRPGDEASDSRQRKPRVSTNGAFFPAFDPRLMMKGDSQIERSALGAAQG
jgi:hypothetical protein